MQITQSRMFVRLLALAAGILAFHCEAQTFYVRSGASGNGSNWNTAFGSLPAVLQRGATYYIAGGNYSSYRFNDPVVGTSVITIKKATVADHGTDVGWVATYGTDQAVWNGSLDFDTDYWVFDGQTRNESDWFAGAAYGFKISGDEQQIRMGYLGNPISNVQIKDTYLLGPSTQLPNTTIRRYGLDVATFKPLGAPRGSNLLVRACLFQYGNVPLFISFQDGLTLEYSAVDSNDSNPANHGEAMSAYYTDDHFIIRYNKFRQVKGTAVIAFTHAGAGGAADGFQIYGNDIWRPNIGDGVFGFNGQYPFSNTKIYNNTIVDSIGNAGIAINGLNNGNEVYNNLWVNCENGFGHGAGATYKGNAYSWNYPEAGAQTNVQTSIFVNYTGGDFRLTFPTLAGTSVAGPSRMDMFGKTRGADGNWERGAYEFDESRSGPVVSVSPATLRFGSVPVNTSRDLTLTVQNIGIGTLAGVAKVSAPFSIVSGGTYNLGASQSQSVIIRWSPVTTGSNWQSFTFTGGGGAIAEATGISTP